MNIPYETQAYAIMVLEGSHGDGSRSAMRKAGWETLPRGGSPDCGGRLVPSEWGARTGHRKTSRATAGRRSLSR